MKKIVFRVLAAAQAILCILSLCACSTAEKDDSPKDVQTTAERKLKPENQEGYVTEGSGYTVTVRWCTDQDSKIYGELYLPEGVAAGEKLPTIIFSHGLRSNHDEFKNYAVTFVKQGYACYVFDYCGGSPDKTLSDGDFYDMTVMTEIANLKTVIGFVKSLDMVDGEDVTVIGGSQGSVVAALTAADVQGEITRLVCLYPFFAIVDNAHENYPTKADIPEEGRATIIAQSVGTQYIKDIYDLDFAATVSQYKGPVLICIGTKDEYTPVETVEAVAEKYENANLVVVEGAPHNFFGDYYTIVTDSIKDFLK